MRYWYSNSVRLSVCLSICPCVRLSVTFRYSMEKINGGVECRCVWKLAILDEYLVDHWWMLTHNRHLDDRLRLSHLSQRQWRSQRGGLGGSNPLHSHRSRFYSHKITVSKYYNLSLTTRRTINSHDLRKTNHLGVGVRRCGSLLSTNRHNTLVRRTCFIAGWIATY